MTTARTWLLLASLLGAAACDRDSADSPPPPRAAASSKPAPKPVTTTSHSSSATPPPPVAHDAGEGADDFVPAGSPLIPLRTFDFAIYLPAPVAPALVADAEQRVRAAFPKATLQKKPEPAPPPTVVVFAPELDSFGLPNGTELGRFEHGLTRAQMVASQQAKGALLLGWLLDADPKWAELRKAQEIALDVASKANGLLWDDGTKELFTPAAWKKLRVEGWLGDTPDVRNHFSTHYYRTEGHNRMVTLGMAELGLPDLVVDDVPVMDSATVQALLQGISQLLVEGSSVGQEGKLTFDLKAIRHPAVRAAVIAAGAPDASLRGSVVLGIVDPEEGDADNRLAEVVFDGYPGATDEARESAGIHAVFGAVAPELFGREAGDAELRAIAKKAQARAPALAAAFNKGLGRGERISVKVPVAREGESIDWGWVVVSDWKGDVIHGVAESDSTDPNPLAGADEVEAKQAWIADYVWQKPGGVEEGGDSMKVLAKRPPAL